MARLLVGLRFSALGDLVLCSAAAQEMALTRSLEDRLAWATHKDLAPLVEENFEVLGAHGDWRNAGRQAARDLLKDFRPDEIHIFDFHGIRKSHQWSKGFLDVVRQHKLSARVHTTPKHSLQRWLSVILMRQMFSKRYVFQDHLELVQKALNLQPTQRLPRLRTEPGLEKRSWVLLAPDARHWKKRWPTQSWNELIQKILSNKSNEGVTLVGGKDSLPQGLIAQWVQQYPGRIENMLGLTQTFELADLAAQHKVTICSNSAWQHLSESVGTPVVSLAGPIVPSFGFSPFLDTSRELSVPLSCRPCTRHGQGICYLRGPQHHACMTMISANDVVAEIQP